MITNGMNPMADPDQRRQALLSLVTRDYDQTAEFIRSIVGTSATTRGWAVTVWLAVLGVGIQQNNWGLALLAAVAMAPFVVLDSYQSWLYGRALRHARALEKLEALSYVVIESGEDDPDLLDDLDTELAANRFGLYRSFKRFSVKELLAARPVLVFRVFYPGLAIVAAATALIIGL